MARGTLHDPQVQLKRVALLDVEQYLKDAQQQQQQQQPSATEAGTEGATPSSSSSSSSSAAAAVAVLDLVSRASAAWAPDSVRSSAGSYVSYKQEDPNNRVSGFLPLKVRQPYNRCPRQPAPDWCRTSRTVLPLPRRGNAKCTLHCSLVCRTASAAGNNAQ